MSAARKPKMKTNPYRLSLYRTTQAAKTQLRMDDETFADVVEQLFPGKRSRKSLGNGQLVELIEHLRSHGFQRQKREKKAPARAGKRPLADGDMQAKMRALWISLYHLTVVREPAEQALVNFARRVTGGRGRGIEALQWLDIDQANKVIEALKAIGKRDGGVSWQPYRITHDTFIETIYKPRQRVLEAQWRALNDLGAVFSGPSGLAPFACRCAGCIGHGILDLSDEQADRVIEALGTHIRTTLATTGHESLKGWKDARR